MEHMELSIEGMSCDHCVRAVTTALAALPGVQVERVEVGAAAVEFDPARTSRAAIVEAVNDEGYAAHAAPA